MNKITFGITDSYLYEEKSIHPQHISKQIPDWYKKVPSNIEKEYPFKYLNKTKTVKSCSSFINVFNNGYVIYAPTDIIIKYDEKTQTYVWEVSYLWNTMFERTEVIVPHNKNQMIDYVPSNAKDAFSTAFHDSIDATSAFGITTGISAKERSITAALIASDESKPDDFIKPGHLFPVVAKEGGVLTRPGHTEASVDLCMLTNQPDAAIICEIMDTDGNMMRRDGLFEFARHHQIPIITIQQLIDHRKKMQ